MQKMSEKEINELVDKLIDLSNDLEVDMFSVANLNAFFEESTNAIQALLEEIQQYRTIGTVEELKELKYNGAFSGIELANIAASLAELQKYQAIGTVDQCLEAVERMKPKKVKKIQIPNTSWSKACTRFECPSCNKYLNYMELSHCGLCGQEIDWSE